MIVNDISLRASFKFNKIKQGKTFCKIHSCLDGLRAQEMTRDLYIIYLQLISSENFTKCSHYNYLLKNSWFFTQSLTNRIFYCVSKSEYQGHGHIDSFVKFQVLYMHVYFICTLRFDLYNWPSIYTCQSCVILKYFLCAVSVCLCVCMLRMH